MAVALFEKWFINCLISEVEKFCTGKDAPFKILLTVGNVPGHLAHLDDFHTNVKVVFLPPKNDFDPPAYGSECDRKFKAYFLRRTLAQAVEAIDRDAGNISRDFGKSYNIYQAILNIAKAWTEVSQKLFECCV
jgi:hypothetical protein